MLCFFRARGRVFSDKYQGADKKLPIGKRTEQYKVPPFALGAAPRFFLLTNAELCNDGTITLDVLFLKIVKEVAPVTNHLMQTAS